MAISLTDSVTEILKTVEAQTGKRVEFIEKNDLQTYAALKMARRNMPSHLILYKAQHDDVINHLVAHECGHLLRMFAVPEEKRVVPYSDSRTKEYALGQIESEINALSALLPFDHLAQVVNLWYAGIVRQVTNIPPDIMIENWIYTEYPALRPYQARSIQKQLNEGISALSPTVSRITPGTILDASNIMNYVFFRILGLYFGTNFIKAYNNTPYVSRGKDLASITEKDYINSYEGDVQMAERWAKFLNLSGWFRWQGFEDVPDNYSVEH